MTSKISREVAANMAFLERDRWKDALGLLDAVRLNPTPETERRAADYLADNLKGIGPKQSRNLLQGIGVSKWETPIDSRITKWLNRNGFPLRLSANALANRDYYNLVSEGFQRLCAASKIAPCVMDAAIFSSYDGDGWTEENVVW
jgi:thermostable 8-oxoguanine DNA glycosylase